MIEALHSFQTSALTRATRRNIPEDDILHSYRRENLKSYIENVIVRLQFVRFCFITLKTKICNPIIYEIYFAIFLRLIPPDITKQIYSPNRNSTFN
jgi:hypothetical protein